MNVSRNAIVRIVCLSVALLATGCTRSSYLTVGETWQTDELRNLNEKASRKRAALTLSRGREFQAEALRIDPDSVTWLDPKTKKVHSAASAEVLSVSFKDHGRGAGQGLGLGVLFGGLLLAPVGLASGDDPACARDAWICLRLEAEQKAALTGAFGAGLGGLIGLISGAGSGAKDVYRVRR